MTDPRDPVLATLRWQFPFRADGAPHVILYKGEEIAVRQLDGTTAEVELVDVEMAREVYDAITDPDAHVRFIGDASDE
jgi:hypothetical protein